MPGVDVSRSIGITCACSSPGSLQPRRARAGSRSCNRRSAKTTTWHCWARGSSTIPSDSAASKRSALVLGCIHKRQRILRRRALASGRQLFASQPEKIEAIVRAVAGGSARPLTTPIKESSAAKKQDDHDDDKERVRVHGPDPGATAMPDGALTTFHRHGNAKSSQRKIGHRPWHVTSTRSGAAQHHPSSARVVYLCAK